MIISNYKLGCTNCGNIPLELCKSVFVLQQHCRWLPHPGKQLLNIIWDAAFGGEVAVMFLISISLLAANSTSTMYLSTQLVGIPNSRWINKIRNVTTAQGSTECAQSAGETLGKALRQHQSRKHHFTLQERAPSKRCCPEEMSKNPKATDQKTQDPLWLMYKWTLLEPASNQIRTIYLMMYLHLSRFINQSPSLEMDWSNRHTWHLNSEETILNWE